MSGDSRQGIATLCVAGICAVAGFGLQATESMDDIGFVLFVLAALLACAGLWQVARGVTD